MTPRVWGIGWVDARAYGCVGRQRKEAWSLEADLQRAGGNRAFFAYPVKNYARFNRPAQLACCAIALALRDAGVSYSADARRDMAVVGASEEGCLAANREYFADYVACGRTLARGNLFIYTLPTSPLAEAAIHFGFQGPLFHVTTNVAPLARLVALAAAMVRRGETTAAMAVLTAGDRAMCLALAPALPGDSGGLCSADEAAAIAPPDWPRTFLTSWRK